jgi:hypothetical protein
MPTQVGYDIILGKWESGGDTMAIARELELYAPIKEWLEQRGFVVRSEVKGCDIVARHPSAGSADQPIIVELKKAFSLPLLYQAVDRLQLTPFVYVGIEAKEDGRGGHKRKRAMVDLCRRLRIGLLLVRFRGNGTTVVEVALDPVVESQADGRKPTPRVVRKQQALLKEFQLRSGDHNTGGMTRTKIVTAYREQALLYAYWLQQDGPSSARLLREKPGAISAKVHPILHDNNYGWFTRVERGIYALTPEGEVALVEYAHIVREILK